ncbi:hypothetical protein [Streptacidiphilus carbonis]|uniref:hypothetical protein n=1 Tax=Streptacidiphilus carbonis TaxID=105422 RepID=UPI0005A73C4E|nr:hypothetical protein [Streptacidiphilus carbonis]
MTSTLPHPASDCAICRECSQNRQVRQERRKATRDKRRTHRDAARLAVSDRVGLVRHLAHPGSTARRSLRQWRNRIVVWSVQGLVLAIALVIVTYIASHLFHIG